MQKKQLKLSRKRPSYVEALRQVAGTISVKDHPEWKDISSVVEWVNQTRSYDNRDYSNIPYGKK